VHGRSQAGLDSERLKSDWLAAFRRGVEALGRTFPADIEVAFPYYGDKLEKLVSASNVPLTDDIQARGGQDNEFLAFQHQIAEEVRQRAGVTDAQVDAEYTETARPRGPLNWQWVQAILRAIDKHGGGLSQSALEAFTRDVFLYITHPGVRAEIDEVVGASLTEAPTVVVGHSLGSIVTYSVLRSDTRKLRVPFYLTVGSPLGIRAVRDQFRPLRFPLPVKAWFNAFDPRDVVALYPLDKDNFPVTPAIENFAQVRNHTDNRHGIVGYLDNREVAKKLLDALGP
jgi:hypothetical protein